MAKPKFKIYKDLSGQWRWRFQAANGEVMADSGESYTRRRDCDSALANFTAHVYQLERKRIADELAAYRE